MPRWLTTLVLVALGALAAPAGVLAHVGKPHCPGAAPMTAAPTEHALTVPDAARIAEFPPALHVIDAEKSTDPAGDVRQAAAPPSVAVASAGWPAQSRHVHAGATCCCQGASMCGGSGGNTVGGTAVSWSLSETMLVERMRPPVDTRAVYAAPLAGLERPPKA